MQQYNNVDMYARLVSDITAKGLPAPPALKMDGSFTRWGDKGSKPCWGIVHMLNNGHAAASYGDWRSGSSYSFKSWEDGRAIDPNEAQRILDELARRQKITEDGATATKAAAAKRDAEIWELLPQTGQSDYLVRKQVGAYGVRFGADLYGEFVAVPIRTSAGKFTGFQRIYTDGRKHFPKGAEKKGAYHLIGTIEPDGVLSLAEGYATGATVHEATGLPVVVCFDAGNLRAVADAIKAIHPDLQLIVAADNDQWKAEEQGPDGKSKGNTGVKTAFAVARAYPGTRVAIPSFDNLDTSNKPTDFNDLLALTSLNNVRTQLEKAVEPKSSDDAAAGLIGGPNLILTEHGKPKALDDNVREILAKDKHWQGVFGYDEFSNRVILLKRPPYDKQVGEWIPRMLADTDATKAAQWMQRKYDLPVSPRMVNDSIVAYAADLTFHPVKDYLQSLQWDGVARLDKWLIDYMGAVDNEYTRAVAAKTLIAAVARIYRPGCKVDTCTIMEGEQGLGKSTAWRILASDKWFSDSLPAELSAKDAMSHLADCWIVELAELSSMARSAIEATKRFISATQDKYRPAYGRNDIIQPRQCIFVGTTNEDRYLKDSTGNRRFWPVTVTKKCDIESLAKARNQLWAEAVARFQAGEAWHLTGELEAYARAEQEDRVELDAWEEPILTWLEAHKPDFVTTTEIAQGPLEIDRLDDINALTTKRIGTILRSNGWKRANRRVNGVQTKGFAKEKLLPLQAKNDELSVAEHPLPVASVAVEGKNSFKINAATPATPATPDSLLIGVPPNEKNKNHIYMDDNIYSGNAVATGSIGSTPINRLLNNNLSATGSGSGSGSSSPSVAAIEVSKQAKSEEPACMNCKHHHMWKCHKNGYFVDARLEPACGGKYFQKKAMMDTGNVSHTVDSVVM